MKTGLTSVTFRRLTAEQVIELAVRAQLDGIEWGGDVHVPPGDPARAEEIAAKTRAAGLEVLSYGSYFYAEPDEDGTAVAETAAALGAPVVRIWAGKQDSDDMTEADFPALAARIETFCRLAAEKGLRAATEYHRGTATSSIEATEKLLSLVRAENFNTYFQPDPRYSFGHNLAALERLAGRVENVHVFQWDPPYVRKALDEGRAVWKAYIKAFHPVRPDGALIMEFVRDDSPEQFLADASVLHEIMAEK